MSNFSDNNNSFGNNSNNHFGFNKRPNTPPFPLNGRGRTGLGVRLRGLPYSVNEAQVRDFFKPLVPANVVVTVGRDGRPRGECECDFENQNLVNEAMKYDKKYIGNRYIEIFPLTGNKVQNTMSIGTLMKQDFSRNQINNNNNNNSNNNNNFNNDFNSNNINTNNNNGYMTSFESNSNPMPVPPPPLLPPSQAQQQQTTMTSLLGPVPPVPPQMGTNTNINEMIFADMAKQMTQLYNQFQTQQHQYYAQAGLNMINTAQNHTTQSNRRF